MHPVIQAIFVLALIYVSFRLLIVIAARVLRVLAYYHSWRSVELLQRAEELAQENTATDGT